MKRAAAYARFSSTSQREESIDAQLRAIREYADRNGYAIVAEYVDNAKSARYSKRPQFQQMLHDAKSEAFDFIIVHKLDRFARNRTEAAITRYELKKYGVKIVSVLENLDDSPESIILESLLEGMAEYYSLNLAREVMKGLMENARKGLFNGGRPPLGYDVVDGKYVINEFEAQAVKLIFDMFVQGYSYPAIINQLNKAGYRTKFRNPFGKNSIHEILRNEKYIGNYAFNRRRKRDETGKRSNRAFKQEEEVVRIKGAIPAIIEEDVFIKVQKKMDSRRVSTRAPGPWYGIGARGKEIYVLSGLVFCGHCGNKMHGNIMVRGGKQYKYYSCEGRRAGCKQPSIPKHVVENKVIEVLAEVLNPDLAEQYTESLNALIEKQCSEKIPVIEEKMQEIDNQISNLLDLIQDGCDLSFVKPRLNGLALQKAKLESEIKALSAKAPRKKVSVDTVAAVLRNIKDVLQGCDLENIQQICRSLIERVTVTGQNVVVSLNP